MLDPLNARRSVAAFALCLSLASPAQSLGQPAQTPELALSPRVVGSASAFLTYMQSASAIEPGFVDAAGVARSVRIGAAYEARQFRQGLIAYVAMAALREPAFVNGARRLFDAEPDGGGLAQILASRPEEVLRIEGADAAAGRASSGLLRRGEGLLDAGRRVKQASYDIQRSAWAKADVAHAAQRLAGAKSLSQTPISASPEESVRLVNRFLTEAVAGASREGRASPLVLRGLAIAALAAVGRTEDTPNAPWLRLLDDDPDERCLTMAKLNLFQCLAVAGPHYEDVFCLGQHAMMDTAQCVIAAAGPKRSDRAALAAPQSPWEPTTSAPQGR